VEAIPGVAAEPAIPIPPPPRQRWRLVLARSAGEGLATGRDLADAWDATVVASGLPVHRPVGKSRARVAFGAPIPASIALEHELADIVLTELVPRWRVRDTLRGALPEGWRLVDLHDVWLGEPPLAGQVAAGDYRIAIDGAEPAAVEAAARDLLAAPSLPRDRPRGGEVIRYDLRPLLADVRVVEAGPPLAIRVRTRFHPALGTGRPEEVVAALGDALGIALIARAIVRERVLLAGEVDGNDR
jgi:hypothetical protein